MELQVGVKAIIRSTEGKYLLLRRSEKSSAKGVWDIVGGRINAGTLLRENLIREIKEETGFGFTGEAELLAAQDIFPVSGGRHVVRLTYLIHMDGMPVLNPEEHEEFRWVTFQELQSWPNLDSYLKEILNTGALNSA